MSSLVVVLNNHQIGKMVVVGQDDWMFHIVAYRSFAWSSTNSQNAII